MLTGQDRYRKTGLYPKGISPEILQPAGIFTFCLSAPVHEAHKGCFDIGAFVENFVGSIGNGHVNALFFA